jgi:hypothetical protein
MEGGDEDMEANVTTQPNDESIRKKSDQFMEDQSDLTLNRYQVKSLYMFKKFCSYRTC